MPKHPNVDFANRLKDIIADSPLANMEKKELAKRFECSGAMVTLMLKGERLPAMELATRMATELGYCVEYLLTGRGAKHPIEKQTDEAMVRWITMMTPESLQQCASIIHALGDKIASYQAEQKT